MPLYKIPVTVFLDMNPEDEEQARDAVLDALLAGLKTAGIIHVLLDASGPEELPPDRADAIRVLRGILDRAGEDSRDGNMITVEGYGNVKFSPQAAAQLAALRFEAGQ